METTHSLHLLVVEDHPDTRRLLGHLLGGDVKLTTAPDAERALAAIGSAGFDLLLIDINLGGGKSGVELLHGVRDREDIEAGPAIAVTAYAMPGDREALLSEGFDGYVGKPFSRQDLVATIEGVL